MNCSPPGFSIHGILLAKILERAAISSSRGSSQPGDWTHVSRISWIGRQILLPLNRLGRHTEPAALSSNTNGFLMCRTNNTLLRKRTGALAAEVSLHTFGDHRGAGAAGEERRLQIHPGDPSRWKNSCQKVIGCTAAANLFLSGEEKARPAHTSTHTKPWGLQERFGTLLWSLLNKNFNKQVVSAEVSQKTLFIWYSMWTVPLGENTIWMLFPCGSAGKESTCNAGDLSSIPGLGRSPGEGKGYPLQYSGLENSMDCIVHGVTKSWIRLSDFHFLFFFLRKWIYVLL